MAYYHVLTKDQGTSGLGLGLEAQQQAVALLLKVLKGGKIAPSNKG